jgi:hypothetical protein
MMVAMHIQATVHTFRCCDILIAFPSSGAEFFRSSLRVIDNSLRLRQHPVLALLAVDFSNQADVVNEVSAAVCVKLNRHLDNEAARWRWRPGLPGVGLLCIDRFAQWRVLRRCFHWVVKERRLEEAISTVATT